MHATFGSENPGVLDATFGSERHRTSWAKDRYVRVSEKVVQCVYVYYVFSVTYDHYYSCPNDYLVYIVFDYWLGLALYVVNKDMSIPNNNTEKLYMLLYFSIINMLHMSLCATSICNENIVEKHKIMCKCRTLGIFLVFVDTI